MTQVSRPLLGVLAATIVVAIVWLVVLRPGSGPGSNAPLPSNASAPGGKSVPSTAATVPVAVTPAPKPATTAKLAPVKAPPTPVSMGAGTIAIARPAGVQAVTQALQRHDIVIVLFYNAGAADDQAMQQALAQVPARAGLFKLAVPISDVGSYSVISTPVPVSQSPTLVIVDRHRSATMIVGYADPDVVNQRIEDAFQQ